MAEIPRESLVGGGLAGLGVAAWNLHSRLTEVEARQPEKAASFIVRKRGKIEAVDGNNGKVRFSSDDLGAVINEAINILTSIGGGKILIKRGSYTLNESIKLKSNIMLEGERGSTVLQLKDDKPAIEIKSDRVTISNLMIKGSIPHNERGIGVKQTAGSHCLYNSVRVWNLNTAFQFEGDVWQTFMYDVYAFDVMYGVRGLLAGGENGPNVIMRDTWFHGTGGTAVYLEKANAAFIIDCQMMAFGQKEDGSGIEIHGTAPGMPVIRGTQCDGTETRSLYGIDIENNSLTHISDVWAKGRLAGIRARNCDRLKIRDVTAISTDSNASPIILDHVKNSLISGRFISAVPTGKAGVLIRGDSVDNLVDGITSDCQYGAREEKLDDLTPDRNLFTGNFPVTVSKVSLLGEHSSYITRDMDRIMVGRHIEPEMDYKLLGKRFAFAYAIGEDKYVNMLYGDDFGGVDIFTYATTGKYFKVWKGDIILEENGKGIVVRTPDGTKQYRIRVDDTGAVVTELV